MDIDFFRVKIAWSLMIFKNRLIFFFQPEGFPLGPREARPLVFMCIWLESEL